jgi:phage gpG-like protein
MTTIATLSELAEKFAHLGAAGKIRFLEALQDEGFRMVAAIKLEKLSGQVLKRRTGTLSNSIISKVEEEGGELVAKVGSFGGVPYARIHEYGGTYLRHRTNARAGSNASVGTYVTMPERSYLRSTLAEQKEAIAKRLGRVLEKLANE